MYQQYELLAQLKSKEIEANAREAWKFASFKKENPLKNFVTSRKSALKSESKTYSCVTC